MGARTQRHIARIQNGGQLDAQESGAYAQFRQASENYRSTVLSSFQEVEDNLALLHWLGQESIDEEAGEKAAQHTLDVAFNLYRQGADSYLEVVTAQTDGHRYFAFLFGAIGLIGYKNRWG